jgi:hypothetical protein
VKKLLYVLLAILLFLLSLLSGCGDEIIDER